MLRKVNTVSNNWIIKWGTEVMFIPAILNCKSQNIKLHFQTSHMFIKLNKLKAIFLKFFLLLVLF